MKGHYVGSLSFGAVSCLRAENHHRASYRGIEK